MLATEIRDIKVRVDIKYGAVGGGGRGRNGVSESRNQGHEV